MTSERSLSGSGEQPEQRRSTRVTYVGFRSLGQSLKDGVIESAVSQSCSILSGVIPDDYADTIDVLVAGLARLSEKHRIATEENEALKLRMVSM
jgi:hypothetical protein